MSGGGLNTCLGSNSGQGITTGTSNTFVGYFTGFQAANGTGTQNVCVGTTSGDSMTNAASGNTLVGHGVGSAIMTATNNTCIALNAGGTVTGASNIIIGNNAAPPTIGNSNQIAIGTASETMYIQGGFNLRVGTQITGATNLSAVVLAQFYTFTAGTAYTITLPAPTNPVYLGATVTFKRKTNNTNIITFAAGAGTPFIPIGSITAATIALATTIFQITLVCDGANWCSISQA